MQQTSLQSATARKGTLAGRSLAESLGIGTTTPYSRLEVWGPDTASTSAFAVVNSASTTVFSVFDSGNSSYSGSIFQSSDLRLKTNVSSLNVSSSLSAIEALNPVSYLRLDQPGQGKNLGFLAQQVASVFPELVSTTSATALTPGGTLTLNYEGLIAPIVGAIQALAERDILASGFAQSITTHLLAADTVQTQQLCVGSTCVTPAQFQAMVPWPAKPTQLHQGRGVPRPRQHRPRPTHRPSSKSTATTRPPFRWDTYTDLGAIITGPQPDLNLGLTTYLTGILTDPLVVETSQPATDTIDYVATDQNGPTSTSTRTLIIEPPQSAGAGDAASTGPGDTSPTTTTP
jgi:hypothetical protein